MAEKKQASIDVLDYPENVRLRRGMYLKSPNHCIQEIVDNAVDEFMAGHCNTIGVAVVDDQVIVQDNGAGIPVTPHEDPRYANMPQVEVAMTVLHAGGKFGADDGYKTNSAGMNGVGASCVNAVSDSFQVIVRTDGIEYGIDFSKGRTVKKLYQTGEPVEDGDSGTEVHFTLDKEVWGDEWYDFPALKRRLKELAYLNPGLTIQLLFDTHNENGAAVQSEDEFNFPEGLKGYIQETTKSKELIIDPINFHAEYEYTAQIHPSTTKDGVIVTDYSSLVDEKRVMDVDVAIAYTTSYGQDIKSFVNNVGTDYGGDHQTGFNMGIFDATKQYLLDHKLIKKLSDVESDDCRDGMCALISVKLKDPNFEGQGKSKIKMPLARTGVKNVVGGFLKEFLEEDENRANTIMEKVLKAIKAREAARRAREAARAAKTISIGSMPKDFADCTWSEPSKCEIFLVEGDSAGGSAKQARDRRFQAILPVFGKVQNAAKSTFESAIKSLKLQDMIKAFGCGVGDEFNIDKLNYHRIILMSDADSDGGHIQCLHMVNQFMMMRPIVEAGYLYVACPPLYKASKKVGKKEEVHYLYNDDELAGFDTTGYTMQRYKGLEKPNPYHLFRLSAGLCQAA